MRCRRCQLLLTRSTDGDVLCLTCGTVTERREPTEQERNMRLPGSREPQTPVYRGHEEREFHAIPDDRGRKRREARAAWEEGLTPHEVAAKVGVSVRTVYRAVRARA